MIITPNYLLIIINNNSNQNNIKINRTHMAYLKKWCPNFIVNNTKRNNKMVDKK